MQMVPEEVATHFQNKREANACNAVLVIFSLLYEKFMPGSESSYISYAHGDG